MIGGTAVAKKPKQSKFLTLDFIRITYTLYAEYYRQFETEKFLSFPTPTFRTKKMYGKKRSNASQIPKHCLIVFFFSPLCTCYSRTALLSVFLCMHGFLLVFETSSRIHMYPSHLRNAREKKIICVFLYNYSQSVPFPAHFPVHVDFLTVFSSNSQMGIERERRQKTHWARQEKKRNFIIINYSIMKSKWLEWCVCADDGMAKRTCMHEEKFPYSCIFHACGSIHGTWKYIFYFQIRNLTRKHTQSLPVASVCGSESKHRNRAEHEQLK